MKRSQRVNAFEKKRDKRKIDYIMDEFEGRERERERRWMVR